MVKNMAESSTYYMDARPIGAYGYELWVKSALANMERMFIDTSPYLNLNHIMVNLK